MRFYVIDHEAGGGGYHYYRYRSLYDGHVGKWYRNREQAEQDGESHAEIVQAIIEPKESS